MITIMKVLLDTIIIATLMLTATLKFDSTIQNFNNNELKYQGQTQLCPYRFILIRSPLRIPYDPPATKTIAAPLGISKKYDSQRPERVNKRLTKEA